MPTRLPWPPRLLRHVLPVGRRTEAPRGVGRRATGTEWARGTGRPSRAGWPVARRSSDPRGVRLQGRLGPGVHAGLLALLVGDRRRRRGERVVATAGLGEGDDLADGVRPRQQRADAVPAEGDAAVRRGAVREGLEQEAELLLGVLLRQSHHREDALLDVGTVDTDGPATDLVAVAHHVVGVG